jgi:hypothetical protein
VSFGVSTAPQRWGPAREYPLVLGPNGGGFPHAYLGTGAPLDVGLGRLQARMIFGQLAESETFEGEPSADRRFASALAFLFQPRGVNGLEIGATRFVSGPWTTPTLRQLTRPFSGLITQGTVGENELTENQVASAFFRWALPSARVEFYGEMYREDYAGTFRWFLEKPDDLVSYTVGFQRVLSLDGSTMRVIRAELVSGETSHQERGQRGGNVPLAPYRHTGATQGHTHNGLLLGAPEAIGGAGWRVGFDNYTPRGRITIALERALRFDWLPGLATSVGVRPDVQYAARLEAVRFHGVREFRVSLIPIWNLNRNLEADNDVFGLSAVVSLRGLY